MCVYIILHHCNTLKLFPACFNAGVKWRDAITFTNAAGLHTGSSL